MFVMVLAVCWLTAAWWFGDFCCLVTLLVGYVVWVCVFAALWWVVWLCCLNYCCFGRVSPVAILRCGLCGFGFAFLWGWLVFWCSLPGVRVVGRFGNAGVCVLT